MPKEKSPLLNIISVPTPNGVKTIEIYTGDITELGIPTDILVISAFANGYAPTPGSLIGALKSSLNIDVSELALLPFIDLRTSMNCWVSDELTEIKIKRLLCIEGINTEIETTGLLKESFSNLFATLSMLAYKDIAVKTVMMPLLGTGQQNGKLEIVLESLISKSIEVLNRNTEIETIYFVDKDVTRADLINVTVNEYLKRDQDKKEEVIDEKLKDLYQEILKKLLSVKALKREFLNNNSINNLISKILSENIKFYEIGILSRKLMELLIRDMNKGAKLRTLNDHIYHLQTNHKIATWMTSYIHVLKNLSNHAAHETDHNVYPKNISLRDRVLFSHSLNRFLEFYLDFSKMTADKNSLAV
jgi:hypothetical protein